MVRVLSCVIIKVIGATIRTRVASLQFIVDCGECALSLGIFRSVSIQHWRRNDISYTKKKGISLLKNYGQS